MKAADTIKEEKEQDEQESDSDESIGIPAIGTHQSNFLKVETLKFMEKDLKGVNSGEQPGIQSATLKKKNINLQDNSNTDLPKTGGDDDQSQGESKMMMRNSTQHINSEQNSPVFGKILDKSGNRKDDLFQKKVAGAPTPSPLTKGAGRRPSSKGGSLMARRKMAKLASEKPETQQTSGTIKSGKESEHDSAASVSALGADNNATSRNQTPLKKEDTMKTKEYMESPLITQAGEVEVPNDHQKAIEIDDVLLEPNEIK